MYGKKSLNPYYTGIHLHTRSKRLPRQIRNCLNPYYTGIHLHNYCEKCNALGKVLILIILEYIYMKRFWRMARRKHVLILIILEYIYILYCYASWPSRFGLNPYYTGIHLHKWKLSLLRATLSSLNPYYTGIHLHTWVLKIRYWIHCLNPYYTGIHLHRISSALML